MATTSTTEPGLSPSDGGKQVRILAWVTAICLLGDSMYYIVLPLYWRQFGLDSLWQVGFLLSINRFVRLPLNPLMGWLYSRISKRAGVMLAVVLACLTTIGYGCLSGFAALLVARALWGAAWSLLRIGGYLTVLETSTGHNRGKLLGSYNGIIAFGSLIGMLAGGLLADAIGARPVALLLGAVSIAGIPYAWKYVPGATGNRDPGASVQGSSAGPGPSGTGGREDQRGAAGAGAPDVPAPNAGSQDAVSAMKADGGSRNAASAAAAPVQYNQGKGSRSRSWTEGLMAMRPSAWLVLASGTGMAIVFYGAYLATLSAVIEAHLPGPNGTITLLGVTLGAASAAGIVQAVRWAWSPYLSPRIGAWSDGPLGRKPLYAASLVVAAAALALLPLKLPFAAWLALLLLAQLANTAIVTLSDALAADEATGPSRVAYMTTYTTVVDVGAAIGPLLGFALLDRIGLVGLYGACAALLLLFAAAWAALFMRVRDRASYRS
ncbi:MFS transporter [Paenibacillus piri]|nr:MFS transporter [Paenibacillus piri]